MTSLPVREPQSVPLRDGAVAIEIEMARWPALGRGAGLYRYAASSMLRPRDPGRTPRPKLSAKFAAEKSARHCAIAKVAAKTIVPAIAKR